MILDICLILLALIVLFVGYRVGFLVTFVKIASVASGLVIAILFTKPVTNLATSWGLDDGISNTVYQNITASDAYQSYLTNGEGVDGISALLTELGLPSFLAKMVANNLPEETTNLEQYAIAISDTISYLAFAVIVFFCLLIFSSILFALLKLLIKALRKSVGIIRVVDGILGIILYAFLFLIVIYVLLLILSFVMQSLPASNGFVSFMNQELKIGTNEFGLTKYLYEHNFLGNLIGLLF